MVLTALPLPPLPSLSVVPAWLNLVAGHPLVSLVLAFLALFTLSLARLVFFPPTKRSLTLTELNTALNRHENGGTGVWARKWRRRFLPQLKYGDEDELAAHDKEGEGEEQWLARWTVMSRPPPSGLKGCLKRAERFEASLRVSPTTALVEQSSASPSPSHPPSPSPSPAPPVPKSAKRVRLLEPSLAELNLLRLTWSSPDLQGPFGAGGIGGYRRTRDFYSKSQGGRAVIKPAPGVAAAGASAVVGGAKAEKERKEESPARTAVGRVIPATKADDDLDALTTEEEDSSSPPTGGGRTSSPARPRRAPRLVLPAQQRGSSLSPSPITRRHTRTLSPASPTSPSHKVSPSRRRALSPVLAPVGASGSGSGGRAQSPSPGHERAPSPSGAGAGSGVGAGAGAAQPKWVKTKSGRMATPAPARVVSEGEEETEEEVDGFDEDDSPSQSSDAEHLFSPDTIPALSLSLALSSPPPTSAMDGLDSVPDLIVSPSTPPLSTVSLPPSLPSPSPPALPPSPSSPSSPTSPTSPSAFSTPSSTLSTASSATGASSPSPCVQKERRLSLRVQQALGSKKQGGAGRGTTAAAAAVTV
ncbi:hypothetical protein JCM8097_005143 [Rhodosporidiobolus ruineniae]